MTVDQLPPRQREVYKSVLAYTEKNNVTVAEAARALNVPASQYYKARAILGGGVQKRKYTRRVEPQMLTITAAPEIEFGQMTLVRGTPSQIAELLKVLK